MRRGLNRLYLDSLCLLVATERAQRLGQQAQRISIMFVLAEDFSGLLSRAIGIGAEQMMTVGEGKLQRAGFGKDGAGHR